MPGPTDKRGGLPSRKEISKIVRSLDRKNVLEENLKLCVSPH